MDNSTQRKCGALLGLVLFTVAGCYFPEDVGKGTVAGDELASGTGGTLGQLATVGVTGMDSGVGAGDADGEQTGGIPGGTTKTGDDDGELDDDSSESAASADGSSGSAASDESDLDSGSSGSSESVGDGDGDTGDEESDMDTTDSGDPACEFPWPACKAWKLERRDFWHGPGCDTNQIFISAGLATLEPRQLVCDTYEDGPFTPKRIKAAWRVVDTYSGNVWRRDEGEVCVEFTPDDLHPLEPWQYSLDVTRLTQFELDTLVVCP